MRVYLSVPIISNRNLKQARFLLETLQAMDHEVVSKWVAEADPGYRLTPNEVFERDTRGVQLSDALVAEVSVPSHGVGMEIMLANAHSKKILCLLSRGLVVSRMVQGVPGASHVEYSSEGEIKDALETFLREHRTHSPDENPANNRLLKPST